MNLRIVADSSANLLLSPQVISTPMRVCTDEIEYVDTAELDVRAMLHFLQHYKGRSSTACPGVGDWLAAFEGADAVLALTITSELSGSHNAACVAAEQFRAQNPGAHIFVLDTRTAGPQMELLAEKAAELAEMEQNFDALVSKLQAYHKKTNLVFSLSSLNNFARNGRVNPALAKAVGILGLRIVGMAKDGNLHPLHKPRGDKKALAQLVSSMTELGWAGGRVRLSHTCNPELAEDMTALLREAYPDCDVRTRTNHGLCGYYCEPGGLLVGFESA